MMGSDHIMNAVLICLPGAKAVTPLSSTGAAKATRAQARTTRAENCIVKERIKTKVCLERVVGISVRSESKNREVELMRMSSQRLWYLYHFAAYAMQGQNVCRRHTQEKKLAAFNHGSGRS